MSKFFTLEQAESIAPLVRSLVRDLTIAGDRMALLVARDALLSECRHAADYRARLQYYRHVEEKAKLERETSGYEEELQELGAEVVELSPLTVGVPFHYKSKDSGERRRKKAYFLIEAVPESTSIQAYQIAGEHGRRAIPKHWRHARNPLQRRAMT